MNVMERYALQRGAEYRGVKGEAAKDEWIDNLILQRLKMRQMLEITKDVKEAAAAAIEEAFDDVFKDFKL